MALPTRLLGRSLSKLKVTIEGWVDEVCEITTAEASIAPSTGLWKVTEEPFGTLTNQDNEVLGAPCTARIRLLT